MGQITIEQAAEAIQIRNSLNSFRTAYALAARINAAWARAEGSSEHIVLSAQMVAAIRDHRMREIELKVAALKRRAAQLDLAMEIEL